MRIEQGLAQLAIARSQNGQPPPESWDLESAAVELRQAVDALREFVRRFVVVSDDALITIALWIMHTHAINAFDATPYLQITSPQKQCGKSRLLEVLELLAARPWLTSKTSAAALVRKVAKDAPTLLLDETDAAFGGEKEYAEALRGIVNAGHRRGGVASLCVGKEHKVEDFPVFCAKALAGIGMLPDTIADRSIRIELQRRLPGEPIHRLRRRLVGNEADALRERLALLATAVLDAFRDARPALPDELSDRAQDAWEPLLIIADAAGFGVEARRAATSLSARSVAEEEYLGLRCLRDIRAVFEAKSPIDRLTSTDMIAELHAIEEGPYGMLHGREFDARTLSKRLRPFRIHPETIRYYERGSSEEKRAKGYMREKFVNAWRRYTPSDEPKREQEPTERSGGAPPPTESREQREQREHSYPVSVSSVNGQRERTREQGDDDTPEFGDDPPFTLFTDVTDIPESGKDAAQEAAVGDAADAVSGAVSVGLVL